MVLCTRWSECDGSVNPALLAEISIRWEAAMRCGDFDAAWRETDKIEVVRRKAERRGKLRWQPYHLVWDGTALADKRVLLRCLHGLGDSIQFLRYCALLKRVAESVTVKIQPPLLPLFAGMDGIKSLLNGWTKAAEPEHDVAIECMELAYAFRHSMDELPASAPYLPIERISGAVRLKGIELDDDFKVGLIWEASSWNPARSIPLEEFVPLGSVRNVRFYSFQQGPALKTLPRAGFPITPLSQHTVRIECAAAAMLEMDLIITVDSMTAHLAGALGRPVWLLLNVGSDWRWMDGREDSPWYPTMYIFRQRRDKEWRPMMEMVAERLSLVSDSPPGRLENAI